MEPFRCHVYLCTQEKPDGLPCRSANGSVATLQALRAAVGKAGLGEEVHITTAGSIGMCGRGPNMVVYPEGVWYSGVKAEDVDESVQEHFVNCRPVPRLQNTDPDVLREEILENKRKALAWLRSKQG